MENSDIPLPEIESSDLDSNPVLNVLIVYEDFAAGKYAKNMYDRLAEQLGWSMRSVCQMWKFDVLAVPKLREMAAQDAVEADVIIVSVHGANQLPPAVQDWFELWVSQDYHAIALVALSAECEHDEANMVRSQLAEVARRGRIKFFSEPRLDAWESTGAGTDTFGDRWGNGDGLSALSQNLQESSRISGWKLNE